MPGNVTGYFGTGGRKRNPVYCRTCKYCYSLRVPREYARNPENGSCLIYAQDWNMKPDDVYFEGKPCKYYVKKDW